MANRLVWAPIVLLSGSVAQVLYHRVGQGHSAAVASLTRVGKWALLGTSAVCVSAFYMEDVFLLALGPHWGLASKLLPLQLLWGGVFLLSTPFRVMCRVLHLQKFQLVIDAFMLSAIAALFTFVETTPLNMMRGLVVIAFAQNCLLMGAVSNFARRRDVRVPS